MSHNFLAFHNFWHLALYHVDNCDHVSALNVYDTHVRPVSTRVAGEMVDASAMLWRLRLRGVDVGDRWTELAASWEGLGDEGYYAFNDVHALMAFLATGNDRQVARIVAALESAAQRFDTNGMMSREVGLPMARALCAFEGRDFDVAIDELQRTARMRTASAAVTRSATCCTSRSLKLRYVRVASRSRGRWSRNACRASRAMTSTSRC